MVKSFVKNCIKKIINKFGKTHIIVVHHVSTNPTIKKSNCLCETTSFKEFISKVKIVSLDYFLLNKKEKGSFCLTFDDGLEDVYTIAFPLLKELNKPFHIFINNDTLNKPGYLTIDQIKEMCSTKLCTIGSHGFSHKDMNKIDSCLELHHSIFESKKELEEIFNCTISTFAYPHGIPTKKAIQILKKSKYKYAFTVNPIKFNNLFGNYRLPRIAFEEYL